jgi:flagellar motility protein MotE (MotC chaperone)
MSKIPRLLPLVGVAIVGVIAVNALGGAHALPGLVSATQAAAEEALHPKSTKYAKSNVASPDPAVADASAPKSQSPLPTGMTGQPAGATIAPVCAPSATDLAKAAGLSPAELQVLQSLQTRRGQIDDREKDIDTEVQLLAAAEAKLDGKLKSMNSLKGDIQALMGQADVKTQAEEDRLVVVYSKMKPGDAAAVMAQLDDKVRLPIAAAMKPAVLSAILGKMGTAEAKDLTEKLAHRFAPIQALAQAANAPIAAPPPTPSAPAPQKGAKSAQAATTDQADDADDASADAKAAPVKKPAAKKRVARAALKKTAPKPKAPAAVAKADPAALPSKPESYPSTKDSAAAATSAPAGPAKAS